MNTDTIYFLLALAFWFYLARVYARHLNRKILKENQRLEEENRLYTARAIRDGLEISSLEKEVKGLWEQIETLAQQLKVEDFNETINKKVTPRAWLKLNNNTKGSNDHEQNY